ncbi:MAG: ExbD/TolR family protein [Oceanococcus sp.]
MKARWRRHRLRHQEPAEMNITAFMNLMVILVPFLLITAVFSRLAVLELDLPSPNSEPSEEDPKQKLTIVVREDGITVNDRGGLIKTISKVAGSYNLQALTDLMVVVKNKVPQETSATLLLEPDIEYDTVIQVMDAVRIAKAAHTGDTKDRELFPAIALGDAPAATNQEPNS